MDIFVSVGTGLNPEQEAFVCAVEDRLRACALNPCSIGRNRFSSEAPLKAVCDLMANCAGTVVIALERYYFGEGMERRGSGKARPLKETALPTPWNQIEAAMGYGRGLPLLVIVDEKLRCDGLLEKGNDWFVFEVPVDVSALNSPAFQGLLQSWRERIEVRQKKAVEKPARTFGDPGSMSVGQLVSALKPSQLWAVVAAIVAAMAGSFAVGARLLG